MTEMTTVATARDKQLQNLPILSPGAHRGTGAHSHPKPSPNAHPYAIKTTSTAILTRSNSTTAGAQTSHYYVPHSPSPHSKANTPLFHRHSRSDTSSSASGNGVAFPDSSPRPLPVPPSFGSPTKERRNAYGSADESQIFSWRTRADTLPGSIGATDLRPSSPIKNDDLPSNPRLWTTSQLSSYLMTALRVRSGETLPLPLPIAKDIAAFVKEARLNGRAFLRLSEKDLDEMGVNNLWRTAILSASRNLRQNVLQGRIWGLGTEVASPTSDKPTEEFPAKLLFSNSIFNDSSSSIDSSGPLHSSSFDTDSTPGKKLQRYKGRVSRHNNGRVKGMVRTYERRASMSSDESGGAHNGDGWSWEDEEAVASASEDESVLKVEPLRIHPPSREHIQGHSGDLASSPISTDSEQVSEVITPASLSLDVLPNISVAGESVPAPTPAEPTIEELLATHPAAAIPLSTSWGAQAWEDIDLNAGVTVKHIGQVPANELPDEFKPSVPAVVHGDSPLQDAEEEPNLDHLPALLNAQVSSSTPASIRRGSKAGSIHKRSAAMRKEGGRRNIADIFSRPLPAIPISRDASEEPVTPPPGLSSFKEESTDDKQSSLQSEVKEQASQAIAPEASSQDVSELESQLEETRQLVEVLRRRLKIVEDKLEEIERTDVGRLRKEDEEKERVEHLENALSSGDTRSKDSIESSTVPEQTPAAVIESESQHSSSSVLDFSWRELASRVSPTDDSATREDGGSNSGKAKAWDPLESGVASYALLVGVGLCAIVLQTMLKKWAGKRF